MSRVRSACMVVVACLFQGMRKCRDHNELRVEIEIFNGEKSLWAAAAGRFTLYSRDPHAWRCVWAPTPTVCVSHTHTTHPYTVITT